MDNLTSTPAVKVTLKTLADHLGLTPGIVSGVLNNNFQIRVPPHTRDRVFDAAKTLGYRPNAIARALRTGERPGRTAIDRQKHPRQGVMLIMQAHHVDQILHALKQTGFRVEQGVPAQHSLSPSVVWIAELECNCTVNKAAPAPTCLTEPGDPLRAFEIGHPLEY